MSRSRHEKLQIDPHDEVSHLWDFLMRYYCVSPNSNTSHADILPKKQ